MEIEFFVYSEACPVLLCPHGICQHEMMNPGNFVNFRGMNKVGSLRMTELRQTNVQRLIQMVFFWIPRRDLWFEDVVFDVVKAIIQLNFYCRNCSFFRLFGITSIVWFQRC